MYIKYRGFKNPASSNTFIILICLYVYTKNHNHFSWLVAPVVCQNWFIPSSQGLTLSIWFTCPSGTWFWKFTCPAKIFTCPANICTSPVKLMYTAGKISTCPDWKITCPLGHVTTKVYVPWDKIYMPRACGHALMSSPASSARSAGVQNQQAQYRIKLEQLERLRSEDTPRRLMTDYPYHWVILDPKSKEDKVKVTNFKKSPKFQIFEFWNGHYTRHTFWSCLIRCANMKWIRWVFLKIQSGHDSVHRRTDGRTDGQGDTSIPPYQLRWSGGYN